MFKRILAISSGVLLAVVLSVTGAHMAALWGLLPSMDVARQSSQVREVMDLINRYYVEGDQAKAEDLGTAAIQGMVKRLDEYSQYLPPRHYDMLREEMENQFGGVGVQVEMREGHIEVVAPIAGGPGERAGILQGDWIVSVEGNPLDETRLDDAVIKLRGKPGTMVRIGVHRPSNNQDFEVNVKREVIHMDSVRHVEMLSDKIGYVMITQFSEDTGEEFVKAIKTLSSEGMQALIIDLRNNPGGLLDMAVEVAQPFFNKGELIVYTQGREADQRQDYRANFKGTPFNLPMAVLINEGSASASEIVSGALQDTGRAVLVGQKSYGKGSVQTIFPVKDGAALRLTTAHYYTPSGRVIHHHGIEPDVKVEMTPEEGKSVFLQKLRPDITDSQEFEERFHVEKVEDRQLDAAVDVLKEKLAVGN